MPRVASPTERMPIRGDGREFAEALCVMVWRRRYHKRLLRSILLFKAEASGRVLLTFVTPGGKEASCSE